MFTGIIESIGTVTSITPVPGTTTSRISIDAGSIIDDLPLGGSLAVNGVCLTAIRSEHASEGMTSTGDRPGTFTADVMGETLDRTAIGDLRPGSPVNLERCMPATGRFDGHIVQGHVDGVGTIAKLEDLGAWTTMRVTLPRELHQLCVEKGSIALNGTSLTITAVSPHPHSWVEVGLIPATLEATVFGQAAVGERVNIEADVLAKYACSMTSTQTSDRGSQPPAPQLSEWSSPQPSPTAPQPGWAPPESPWTNRPWEAPRKLDTIPQAVEALSRGLPVIVVDDEDRENEGDLIIPAEKLTPEWMGFIVRHSSGVVCAPMPAHTALELGLPGMVEANEDPKGTAYTVSCDIKGLSTGISAAERTATIQALADPTSVAADFSRPGHVFPLIAAAGGVRERRGHTEAGVELARLAGCRPVAAIAELVHDSGEMMRLPELLIFGQRFGLPVVSIDDLVTYLDAQDSQYADGAVTQGPRQPSVSPQVPLPSKHGDLLIQAFEIEGQEIIVVTGPESADGSLTAAAGGSGSTVSEEASGDGHGGAAPLVRVHSECLTGDILGSYRCDCGEQLDLALAGVAQNVSALVYVKGHEGRGIGLVNKLCAYDLQDRGWDTVQANEELGFPAEARSYSAVAAVMRMAGLGQVRLLTNNPAKAQALSENGIEVVSCVPLTVPARPSNRTYLETKRDRMAHTLPLD